MTSECKNPYGVFVLSRQDVPKGMKQECTSYHHEALHLSYFASLVSICSKVMGMHERTKTSVLLHAFMLQPAEYCYFKSVCCSNCSNTAFSASGKASSAWTVRVDREMVAMELFFELAWQSNIWQDLICLSSIMQFL